MIFDVQRTNPHDPTRSRDLPRRFPGIGDSCKHEATSVPRILLAQQPQDFIQKSRANAQQQNHPPSPSPQRNLPRRKAAGGNIAVFSRKGKAAPRRLRLSLLPASAHHRPEQALNTEPQGHHQHPLALRHTDGNEWRHSASATSGPTRTTATHAPPRKYGA